MGIDPKDRLGDELNKEFEEIGGISLSKCWYNDGVPAPVSEIIKVTVG